MKLSESRFSIDHERLLRTLVSDPRMLIIQDLDGVCMGLVRDPLTRTMERRYVEAVRRLDGHFYVLTNGEHIGRRGVNSLVERTCVQAGQAAAEGLYLPGLGGGGVQWQDRYGTVSHPGVSDAELAFLLTVPERAAGWLRSRLADAPCAVPPPELERLIGACVLDNRVSPTVNINRVHQYFQHRPECYAQLQRELQGFMESLLQDAAGLGLSDSFFVHYAPNLGRDARGMERIKPGGAHDAGTTDFQLMLRGAVKEAGVLVLLNRYYHQRSGQYPLGPDFNVREAPRDIGIMLQWVREHFDAALMPRIVGVGDTVTAYAPTDGTGASPMRGGSDRGFLTLVQQIGAAFGTDNAVLYVDSSGGEVRRPGLQRQHLRQAPAPLRAEDAWPAHDISDRDDPLRLNFVFPGGYAEYIDFFCRLAADFRRDRADPPMQDPTALP